MPVTATGLFGPTVRASGLPPQTEFNIIDCAVIADSERGTGLLSCCNRGPGLVAVMGTLPPQAPQNQAAWQNTRAGILGASRDGPGVQGISENHHGVFAQSRNGTAIRGSSDNSDGVLGDSANSVGVFGRSVTGPGVRGDSNGTGLLTPGVLGMVNNRAGSGVHGHAPGVLGNGVTGMGGSRGVWGLSSSGNGVQGQSSTSSGVFGISSTGEGVRGVSIDGAAVYGRSYSGIAGAFDGTVEVNGTINKSATAFKIDHPVDPKNKYLYHSGVESPDMKNIYDGIAVLDSSGEATVQLPNWFGALNKDFRYQLTPVGGPGPDLHIAEEIMNNRFKIAGGSPSSKVSWQVTGIRHDAFANAHRIPVEENKPANQRGLFMHPKELRQTEKRRIHFGTPLEPLAKVKKELAQIQRDLAQAPKSPARLVQKKQAKQIKRKNK